MPETTKLSLNAGELSDEMAGRPDLSKFQMGCEIAENVRILRMGGQQRRAGFEYVANAYSQSHKSRLQGFNFGSDDGDSQGYVLEFSNSKMRVYKNGAQTGATYTTPWSATQVFELQFSQRVDRIIATHKDVPIHSIVREANGTWTIEEFEWDERIWELPILNDVILTPSGSTGSVTISASAPVFTNPSSWVGTRLKLNYTKDEEKFTGSSSSTTEVIVVDPVDIFGDWTFETFGNWAGTFLIQRSYNGGATWSTIKTLYNEHRNSKNYILTETEEPDAGASIQVKYTDAGKVPSLAEHAFTLASYLAPGSGIITQHNSTTAVTLLVEEEFIEVGATSDWFVDAFNPMNGYPRSSTFHQSRLFFSGSKAKPQNLWSSRTRRPFDFTQGTLDDDGLAFEMEANEYEEIYWLVSHLSLLVGTSSAVWAISPPDGRSLTPENNSNTRQMRHGSAENVPGVPVDNNVLFLQQRGRKISELAGRSVEYGGYLSVDLTQLASHITQGGVEQTTAGSLPDSTLYAVVRGELAILTYERPQNVVGWARWVTDGNVESVGVTPGAGEDDDIYVSVERDGVRSIEFYSPDMTRVEEANDSDNFVYLDSCVRKYNATAYDTVSGLDHLEGREVEMFLDGEPQGAATVKSGSVTLPREGNTAVVGIPYTSTIRPMPLDLGGIGSKTAFYDMIIRFRNTLGAQVSQDGEIWSDADFSQPRIDDGSNLSLLSEDIQVSPQGTHQRRTSISIRQTKPLPMTVLAIRIKGKTSR
jgi:hypothetical protein